MQDEQTLQQSIREYETNMPPEIMDLIKSFDWKKELRTVVNQNQLMIDVGADLEQSVYLMLLGVVKVQDIYERLMDVHELPEDKAKKIIEEIEELIFKPMHQKLMDLEEKETRQSNSLASASLNNPTSVPDKEPSRDDILAEIEKEPIPVIIKPIMAPQPVPIAPVVEVAKVETVEVDTENDIRIKRPFSISYSQEVSPSKPLLEKPAEGVQQDPVSVGLGQATVVKAQEPQASQAPTKSYVADPYRESIE